MKRVLLISLVVLLSTLSSYAQERGANMEQMMKERTEKYIKELNLEEDKAEKFRKIQTDSMEKMQEEMKSMRESDNSDNREAMREKMKKFDEERDAEIKKLLTDDEYKQYQEIQSKEPRGQRRRD